MRVRRLEYQHGPSDKFYEITEDGLYLRTRWGRRGTNGQQQTRSYTSGVAREIAADTLYRCKIRNGYNLVEELRLPDYRPPPAKNRPLRPPPSPAQPRRPSIRRVKQNPHVGEVACHHVVDVPEEIGPTAKSIDEQQEVPVRYINLGSIK